jgi:hypothetical protein
VESAAGQGLVELADRKMHAELSVHVCRPLVRAARAHRARPGCTDLREASPVPRYQPEGPADRGAAGGASSFGNGRTARCTCTSVPGRMCRRAEDLAERARTARQLGTLWALYLTEEQIESLAYRLLLARGGRLASPGECDDSGSQPARVRAPR